MNLSFETKKALNQLSAQIGRELLLTQGAGGNTSYKTNDVLWVKASGKWLAHAEQEDIFVAVDLNKICADISKHSLAPINDYVITSSQLRPSIETSLHAILPQAVVLHVHSINALAWAVNQTGESQLKKLLAGINWVWVPYTRPGLDLTLAVKQKLVFKPDVFILANHGLVVAADTCATAMQLLMEVDARLTRAVRNFGGFDASYLQQLATTLAWQLPTAELIHSLATDPLSFKMAITGVMYPDHVVFLGEKPLYFPANCTLAEITATIAAQSANYILIENKGVLLNPKISAAALQMLLCQALLLMRLNAADEINYLAKDEINNLLDWEAEKYRQQLTIGS